MLVVREAAEALGQILPPLVKRRRKLDTARLQKIQHVFLQETPPSRLGAQKMSGLVECEPAGPRCKRPPRVVFVDRIPQRNRRLLNDIARIRDVRHQRHHVTEKISLRLKEEPHELLVAERGPLGGVGGG